MSWGWRNKTANSVSATLLSVLGLGACSDGKPLASRDSGAFGDGGVTATPDASNAPTDGPSWTATGVCGRRGEATVGAATFVGFEEYYLIADEGFGNDICVVRFELQRVGPGPEGCADCSFSHLLEYATPVVVLDENDACGSSELGLNESAIAALEGEQVAYGFVSEFAGHNSVLMHYDETRGSWDAFGNATYDQDAEFLRFDRRNGFCGY